MPECGVLVIIDDEAIDADLTQRVAARHGLRPLRCARADLLRRAREEQAVAVAVKGDPEAGAEILGFRRELPAACGLLVATCEPAHDAWQPLLAVDVCATMGLPLETAGLSRALELVMAYLARRRRAFEAELAACEQFGCAGMVGRGPAMQLLFERARRAAASLRTATIAGEPGSGRRRFAALLHSLGPHSACPFITIAPGAGPGDSDPAALRDLVRGGLYVAEPGHQSVEVQRRILDLIRRGSSPGVPDVVVFAGVSGCRGAGTGDRHVMPALREALSRVEFQLPALRQRREDIPGLSAVFLRDAAARMGRSVRGWTPAAELLLLDAPWRGNLPELRATLERAMRLAVGELVGADQVMAALPAPDSPEAVEEGDDSLPLSRVEREHILRALDRLGGNKKAAARALGLSRRALYRKLERLDLGGIIARRPRQPDAGAACDDTAAPAARG